MKKIPLRGEGIPALPNSRKTKKKQKQISKQFQRYMIVGEIFCLALRLLIEIPKINRGSVLQARLISL
jgi:hypothetical protein